MLADLDALDNYKDEEDVHSDSLVVVDALSI